jgi:predicted Zn-ribbon and HTH transcriptional regulator
MEARLSLPRALRAALAAGPARTLGELSSELGVPEKALPAALAKLKLTLRHESQKLHQEPARCLACEFSFEDRERASTPGRCPRCRSERVRPARFWIE